MHWLLFVLQYFLKILSQYPSLNTRGRQYTDFFNATFFRTAKGIGYLHCKYFKLNLLVNYNNNAYDITQYYSDTQWFRLRFWGQNFRTDTFRSTFWNPPEHSRIYKKNIYVHGKPQPSKNNLTANLKTIWTIQTAIGRIHSGRKKWIWSENIFKRCSLHVNKKVTLAY